MFHGVIRMETKELAKQLGISHQMANRYKAKGMPTDTLSSAIEWRRRNVHPFQSKTGRMGGNSVVKQTAMKREETARETLIGNSITHTLTHIIPNLWFGQIGWLGAALRDHGVTVTAEQLIKIQAILFLVYMNEVDEFLETETENKFLFPETLMARPGDEIYSSLIENLNETLSRAPNQLYES